jgi:hypothetical protein
MAMTLIRASVRCAARNNLSPDMGCIARLMACWVCSKLLLRPLTEGPAISVLYSSFMGRLSVSSYRPLCSPPPDYAPASPQRPYQGPRTVVERPLSLP